MKSLRESDKTLRKITEIIEKRYKEAGMDDSSAVFNEDTHIRQDLGFDSIMLVVLQIDIEDAFHIRFNPAEEDCRQIFTTIGNLCRYVLQRLGSEEIYECE